MRYAQLRAFHYVATHGGFSRAAEALYISQPAVSDQVRKLEEEYDILLFDRSKRQVSVTARGLELLEITHRMFDQEQQARDFLTESGALTSGTLRLFVDSAYHVTDLLSSFRRLYPRVSILMRVGNSDDVTSALKSYDADIGVFGEMSKKKEMDMLPLGDSPLVAFAAKGSEFDPLKLETYADLLKYPLVMRETGSKTRQKLEDAAQSVGVPLIPTIVTEGREAVREVVASGAGIGFVSLAEFSPDPRLFQIPLPLPCPVMEEVMVCLHDRRNQKVIRAFMTMAREQISRKANLGLDPAC